MSQTHAQSRYLMRVRCSVTLLRCVVPSSSFLAKTMSILVPTGPMSLPASSIAGSFSVFPPSISSSSSPTSTPPTKSAEPPGTIPFTTGPDPMGPALNTTPTPPGSPVSGVPGVLVMSLRVWLTRMCMSGVSGAIMPLRAPPSPTDTLVCLSRERPPEQSIDAQRMVYRWSSFLSPSADDALRLGSMHPKIDSMPPLPPPPASFDCCAPILGLESTLPPGAHPPARPHTVSRVESDVGCLPTVLPCVCSCDV
mmetsp:Transcript_27858/g.54445  ORF Transcript_27858/g.54445 Transcript_27858/m.54445 type:complete len:252 (-) Transcript_27858:15-770(-)